MHLQLPAASHTLGRRTPASIAAFGSVGVLVSIEPPVFVEGVLPVEIVESVDVTEPGFVPVVVPVVLLKPPLPSDELQAQAIRPPARRPKPK
jgi:hypothetical protein